MYKMIAIDLDSTFLDSLQDEFRTLFGEQAHISKSKAIFLEVTHPEANKASALLFLAQKLGIDINRNYRYR